MTQYGTLVHRKDNKALIEILTVEAHTENAARALLDQDAEKIGYELHDGHVYRVLTR